MANAISIDQIKINADGSFKGLDEVRLYNGTDVLHCKEGFSQGILGTSSTGWKMVSVTWNNGVPAVNSANAPVLGDSVGQSDLFFSSRYNFSWYGGSYKTLITYIGQFNAKNSEFFIVSTRFSTSTYNTMGTTCRCGIAITTTSITTPFISTYGDFGTVPVSNHVVYEVVGFAEYPQASSDCFFNNNSCLYYVYGYMVCSSTYYFNTSDFISGSVYIKV